MDEKESLPEKPSEGSGDVSAAGKLDDVDGEEKSEASAGGDAGPAISAEATDSSSDVKSDSDVAKSASEPGEKESELQNHVDNDVVTEDSSSVKSDVGDGKRDAVDTTDVDSQEDVKDEGMLASLSFVFINIIICTLIQNNTFGKFSQS